ncbi:MAG: Asp-tRNA(Asn)/Glu-tRNA(Gln) amidotransferase subunit GatA [Ruminococcus sp.]|jgi:aspartyl-tRNA(Asn)/glutamyl-tRNA(Gln) amidotransferase subunit A
MGEFLNMTALELGRRIRDGEISVKEAAEGCREQIQKKEKDIQAFLFTDDDKVEKRVEEVEQGIRQGRYTGPLAGVPVAVKDNICTKGMKTTCASRMLENFVPGYDAEAVKRLEEAGMIIVGKTNMDEFAMGSTSETSYFQTTKNPWNMECVPGGSSGGSCAAVASGEVTLALGSDTGGSIRQPASYCGVVGLKPTYGRVSRYGLIAYASSLDQIGPIGRSVKDCAALYEVIAGADEKDASSSRVPVEPVTEMDREDLAGFCIGIPEEYLGEGTDPEVRRAVENAARQMEENGAKVESFSLKMTEYVIPAYYIIACAEASSNLERFDGVKYGYRSPNGEGLHEMYKKSRQEGFGEEVKRRILLGSFVLSSGYYDAYYLKALKTKALIKREFDLAFQKYDCILTPASPVTAPKLGTSLGDPLKMYLSDVDTVAVNLAGLPAVCLPCGMDSHGLPIGMQMIGNCFQEKKILEAAAVYERLRGAFPVSWKEEM